MRSLCLTLLLVTTPLLAQDKKPELTERDRAFMQFVRSSTAYVAPGSAEVEVQRDIRYSTLGDARLRADVYMPRSAGAARHPVVVFIHGGGVLDAPLLPREWGPYQAWGRNVAAMGMVGVMFNHRLGFPEPHLDASVADVKAVIEYVRAHADELHADPTRICLAAYSAGGPLLSLAMNGEIANVKCLVSFYNFLDIQKTGVHSKYEPAAKLRALSPITYAETTPQKIPPMFIARGTHDEIPALNDSIDRFVSAALLHGVDFTLQNHAAGSHGFDATDDRSAEIVRLALEFMQRHLGVSKPPKAADVASALLSIESERRRAIAAKDFASLETIYSDDFRAVFGTGVYMDRAALFTIFGNDDPRLHFTTDELAVRDLGDVALVTGRLTATGGGEIVSQQRFTHVYQRRGDRWMIVAAEGTPVRTLEQLP